LLTESLLLGASGGVLGVLGGWLGLRAIVALRPPELSDLAVAHLDSTTLAAAVCVTLATSLAFGLIGLVQSARSSTHDALKAGAGASAGAGRGRARQLLVVTEMAISATLVVGASMLVRSVSNLQHADLGFDPTHLYSLTLTSARKHFPNAAAEGGFAREIATRLAKIPGVQSVALTSTPPGWFAFSIGKLEIEGEPVPAGPSSAFINVNQIGGGYFGTMGIRLVAGSAFTDTSAAANQVIVNANFARKHWPGASAIGKRLRVSQSGKEPWLTIVGVARDAATGGPAFRESSEPYLYTPAPDSLARAILVRTDGRQVLGGVQTLVRSLDAHVSPKLTSIEAQISNSIAAPRFVMLLLAVFTVLALALAAVGLYGVLAYAVAQRTREIGIRMALGASQARIARAVIARGVVLAAAGASAGIGLSMWGTRLIEHELFGVAQRDVVSFAASASVLLLAAVLACVVPTRRALAVDPMTAIRAE
jgi:putative ABC transport system permease protein